MTGAECRMGGMRWGQENGGPGHIGSVGAIKRTWAVHVKDRKVIRNEDYLPGPVLQAPLAADWRMG